MASSSRPEYLLLDEVVIPPTASTRKVNSTTEGNQRFRSELDHVVIPRGALLSGDSCSFKVEKSSVKDIQLETFTVPGGISKDKLLALSDRELSMLRAVPDDENRYEVHSSGRVRWACGLKIGDKLLVKIAKPSVEINHTGCVDAVLRWSGNPKQEKIFQAIHFGVEIADEKFSVYGESDGSYGGKKLFTCEKNCGLFVTVDKLYSSEPLKCPRLPASNHTRVNDDTMAATGLDQGDNLTKTRSLTRKPSHNLAEIMLEAKDYEQLMEKQIQKLKEESQQLKEELQRTSIKADQQARAMIARAKDNRTLQEKLKQSEQMLREIQQQHEQQLKEQQDQHKQAETQLQQELQDIQQRYTQLQQQLRDVTNEK